MPVSYAIGRFLSLMKWPCAFVSLLILLPACGVFGALFDRIVDFEQLIWVLVPCLTVFLIWFTVIPELGNSFLNTFEHELTHLIFGLLTGNVPTDLDVNQGEGSFSFKGRSNWLMTIAPYFFPTFPFLVMLAGLFYRATGEVLPLVYWGVFGTVMGMYLASTVSEIRTNQTDLKIVGFLFSFCFLPGMHALFIGLMFSFAAFGYDGFSLYFDLLSDKIAYFWEIL